MKKIAIVAGTRPEIIKLAPVYYALQNRVSVSLVSSGQHQSMAQQALDAFSLRADIALDLMRAAQAPDAFLGRAIPAFTEVFHEITPDLLLIQGDTATAFAGALSAFHSKIPCAHVEAGLRTRRLDSPFPEEGYRQMISRITQFHFCPTEAAARNLEEEGIRKHVYVTGNTVVDALMLLRTRLEQAEVQPQANVRLLLEQLGEAPFVYITGHRRENHDRPLQNLCSCLRDLALRHPEFHFVFSVHRNPAVYEPVQAQLGGFNNVHLLEPVDYVSGIALMERARFILSDSGGIQEEAPYCETYVLVTRQHTERPELLESGWGELCPLANPEVLSARLQAAVAGVPRGHSKPFGNGTAATRIADILCGQDTK